MKTITLCILIITILVQGQCFAASTEARAIMTVTPSITFNNKTNSSVKNIDKNLQTNSYLEKFQGQAEGETVIEVIL